MSDAANMRKLAMVDDQELTRGLRHLSRSINVAKKAAAEFARIELELAVTFARMALDATDAERRARNIRNAKRAYTAAIETLIRLQVDEDTHHDLKALKKNVREALADLDGQVV